MLREIVSTTPAPPPLSPPQPTPLFLLYPCLTPISLAGWLVAPYRPSVQPLQPLALHHLHPTTPTLPGPVPTIVPDSTTSSSYSNKMASLELSPTTTDSPNVTLTIRLIMQGKVSTTLLLPSPLPLNPVIGSNDNPRFLCPAKSRRLATADEYIQRAGDADGKVDLVKVQFAQLSLFSASQ